MTWNECRALIGGFRGLREGWTEDSDGHPDGKAPTREHINNMLELVNKLESDGWPEPTSCYIWPDPEIFVEWPYKTGVRETISIDGLHGDIEIAEHCIAHTHANEYRPLIFKKLDWHQQTTRYVNNNGEYIEEGIRPDATG